jgi:hypothetical protein
MDTAIQNLQGSAHVFQGTEAGPDLHQKTNYVRLALDYGP